MPWDEWLVVSVILIHFCHSDQLIIQNCIYYQYCPNLLDAIATVQGYWK